ncbi:hypothetical protein COO60DRAFT_1292051 [Scenedesmus sp. NREL 46B-D3]|nr:hypothetical protein COO60DRAFT_1292051 [Scenedesmus sp. NREL 46B-D3]
MSGENKQSNKVFIGGLSWETSDAKLRSYFENFGSVLEAFVSYDRNTGRPRGFGFVVFESSEVADKVVASKHTIDRREVEAKKAVPKEDNPTPSQPADASQKTRKIFVGGLAPSVDEQVLRQYFEQFGQVEDAVVMYDHDNKRPRGFGFITFAEEESVDNVFSHGAMQNIHDKQIEIKPAVPRDQMPPAARRAPPFFPGRGAGMPGAAAFPPGRAPPYGFRQPGLPAAAYAAATVRVLGPAHGHQLLAAMAAAALRTGALTVAGCLCSTRSRCLVPIATAQHQVAVLAGVSLACSSSLACMAAWALARSRQQGWFSQAAAQ